MAHILRQCSRRLISSHQPIRSQHLRNCPIRALSSETTGEPQYEEPPIPKPKIRVGESIKVQRARLLYQSRKRGMAENCLLLSTFADKFLDDLTDSQLKMYDTLINMPSNDWEIYYWVVGTKPTPKEYDNEVMHMLQEHARNDNMESRIRMPDLKPMQN